MPLKAFITNTVDMLRGLWGMSSTDFQASQYRRVTRSQVVQEYDKILSMYAGRQIDILAEDLRSAFTHESARGLMRQPLTFNVTARIINKLAMLYKTPPVLMPPDGVTVQLMDAIDKSLYGGLKQGDRISELCGLCWVGATWDKDNRTIGSIVVPPDQVLPVWDRWNPMRLAELHIFTHSRADNGKDITLRTVWTDDLWMVMKGREDVTDEVLAELGEPPNPSRVNPYERIPFIPMRPQTPLYGDPEGNYREDLCWINRTLNMKLTELMELIAYQAGSQPYIIGDWKNADIAVGSRAPVHLLAQPSGEQSEFGFASPNARITELWDTVQKMVQYAAFLHNLSGSWVDGGTIPSGEALKVVNADLEEYRRDKEDSHRLFWRDYLPIMEAVAAKGEGRTINKAIRDVEIDFQQENIFYDPVAQAAEWTEELKLGLLSPAEVYQEKWPGTIIADAESKVAENLSAFRTLQSIGKPQAPDVSQFMPTRKPVIEETEPEPEETE